MALGQSVQAQSRKKKTIVNLRDVDHIRDTIDNMLSTYFVGSESVVLFGEWSGKKLDRFFTLFAICRDKTWCDMEEYAQTINTFVPDNDFKKIVDEHWPGSDLTRIFVFLRPTEETAEDIDWINVGYEALAQTFDRVIDKRIDGDTHALEMIRSYSRMLKRHFLMDDRLEKLTASLWSKHREALNFLVDHKPDSFSDLLSKICDNRDRFCKKIGSEKISYEPDDCIRGAVIRLAVPRWDTLEDGLSGEKKWTNTSRVILLEIKRFERKNTKGVRVALYLGPSSSPMRQKWFDAMQKHMTRKGRLSNVWKMIEAKELFSTTDGEDGFDVNEAYEKIVKGMVSFTRDKVSKFHDAIISIK